MDQRPEREMRRQLHIFPVNCNLKPPCEVLAPMREQAASKRSPRVIQWSLRRSTLENTMPAAKPGARRLQILQVLARMLEDPKGEKVTTAALAKELDVAATQWSAEPAGTAGAQGSPDPGPHANLLLCYVMGRWQQYAKSGFKRKPTELWEKQWPLLVRT